MFLGSLRAIGETYVVLDDNGVRALENALRYFRQAAPKHTADEEVSLFPRLRKSNAVDQSTLAEVERLEDEHEWAGPLHDLVEQIGALWIAERKLPQDQLQRFRDSVAQLESMYWEHIKLEDNVLFPIATQVLSSQEKREIGLEMAARRSVAPAVNVALEQEKTA